MDNTLLSKEELKLYDYVLLRNMILDIFKLFRYLKRIDDKIVIPRITRDYRIRYEQFHSVSSSLLERLVLRNLMLEARQEDTRKRLFSKITIALRKLNELELTVFDLTFYQHRSEAEIMEAVFYGKEKVRQIRKSACIKFLSSLGVDDQCFK